MANKEQLLKMLGARVIPIEGKQEVLDNGCIKVNRSILVSRREQVLSQAVPEEEHKEQDIQQEEVIAIAPSNSKKKRARKQEEVTCTAPSKEKHTAIIEVSGFSFAVAFDNIFISDSLVVLVSDGAPSFTPPLYSDDEQGPVLDIHIDDIQYSCAHMGLSFSDGNINYLTLVRFQ